VQLQPRGAREHVPADRQQAGGVHLVREVDLRLHPERVVGPAPLVVEDAPVGHPQVDEGSRLRSKAAQLSLVSHAAGAERDERAQPARAPVQRLFGVGGPQLLAEQQAVRAPHDVHWEDGGLTEHAAHAAVAVVENDRPEAVDHLHPLTPGAARSRDTWSCRRVIPSRACRSGRTRASGHGENVPWRQKGTAETSSKGTGGTVLKRWNSSPTPPQKRPFSRKTLKSALQVSSRESLAVLAPSRSSCRSPLSWPSVVHGVVVHRRRGYEASGGPRIE
jgi:hypothetical protein